MIFPTFGILLHAIGALAAAICFTPQHKIRNWSYESFWFWMCLSSWLLLPVIGSIIFIPNLSEVLAISPQDAMWKSFGFGAAYGLGGMAFGFAIRYIGYSLTYALAIGLSAMLGFFLPPLITGTLNLSQPGSNTIIAGMVVGFLGTLLCGFAGRRKEVELQAFGKTHDTVFKPSIGIPLCVIAGVLSSVYSVALETAGPIAAIALKKGANPDFVININFLFASTGAFCCILPITLWKLYKAGNLRELIGGSANAQPALMSNIFWSGIAGLLWYLQFIFYGMGANRMGKASSVDWPLHMIMLILFSTIVAIIRKEWTSSSASTKYLITIAIGILLFAVIMIGYGNQLNQVPATH
ncbi:MAG: L-rhamnose/proton symporter RhaT [Verrucomicrobiales bacterium]|jgi:L-rhamnose-H+ transport protein